MGDLTPFQNQVLDAAERKEDEERRRQQEQQREGGAQPTRNSRAGPSPGGAGNEMGSEETVRYVNQSEQPDHQVHSS